MNKELSHHDFEKAVINIMNLDGWDLEWCGGEFEHYDAKGKTPKGFDCVIEFKLRHSYYPTKILEKFKYDHIMKEKCIKFYYVFDPKGNYLYYLDKLILPEGKNIKCEATSKFEDRYKMNKICYMLSESQASIVNYNE
jgi:hypothetical protein